MGLENYPEVNLAKRLVEKYELQPPINILGLVQRYATLRFAPFPFEDADGISIDIKVPGRQPRVIVNSNKIATRQRFTLAHELGHIIIPWHVGTIIDHTDLTTEIMQGNYWEIEQEANRFAAELLMPGEWVERLKRKCQNLAHIHKMISERCNVSVHAAAIHLASFLPQHIVYCAEQDGVVVYSGRSPETLASPLPENSQFSEDAYAYCVEHNRAELGNRTLHWWILPSELTLDNSDNRNWREVLHQILSDIGIPEKDLSQVKQSVNGVVAYANGAAKRSERYSVSTVAAACVQRFRDRTEFSEIVEHHDFETFVQKKAEELVVKSRVR
jgi:hypothetical protein